MLSNRTQNRMFRAFLVVIAFTFLLMGVTTYRRGEPDYRNYWGGLVPWWLPIIAAVFAAWAAVKWDRLTNRKRSNRESPKARRNRRKAEKVREAVDDFDKPWTGG